MFGNRGCLHDDDGRLRRPYAGRRWIACRLEFKDRRRPLLRPGRYTELFFLDDATALAAGHRPCAECRREDFRRFLERCPGRPGSARALDARLHAERLAPDRSRRPFGELPDGAFVIHDGAPRLVRGDALLRWTPAGYVDAIRRPLRGDAVVITPPSALAVPRTGWRPAAVPFLHPSADPD